ncbi:MAG: outer membrane beta-barrel protein [Bacteroidetes bacterium]|nr:outer membrane beta-barrel protein [Bacteroidota bacterium]
MIKKIYATIFTILLFQGVFFAQSLDSLKLKNIPISITGYVDAYYAYYTDSLGTGEYQKFPSVSPRSNQFGLNTAHLNFQYDADKVRGVVGLHFGDISKSAWSGNIMEAHAGVRITKKVWVDAGFFRTHFGTEGLMPRENIANSVSLCTFYEPYFESGVRLNYNYSANLTINLYLLNGYNIYEENNRKKSFGTLITYALGENGNIGYSNYIGDDSPVTDTIGHKRSMHNLYLNYQVKKLKIQIGGDMAIQKNSDLYQKNKAAMYSGVLSLKYGFNPKYAAYGRGEIFNDPQGILTGMGYLKASGVTLGLEYKPTEASYVRIEGRELILDEGQKLFYWNNKYTNIRMELMINLGVSF